MAEKPHDDPAASGRALRSITIYALLPVWFVPGVLDWYWHKRTKIEETAGARESLIHLLMMTEVGLPLLAGLFLEINAGVLTGMAGMLVVHECTAMWDVLYATARRPVLPREQHTHSFLEVLPVAGLGAAVALHPVQARAIFGLATESPDFRLRPKRSDRLPAHYTALLIAAIAGFIAVPYCEELVRCLRARPTFRRSRPPVQSPLAPEQTWAHETNAEGFEW
jgi:hypothetical protein